MITFAPGDVWTYTSDEGGAPPDVTAPVLSGASGVAVSDTTANGSVTTDEAGGTLYWVVTTSATPPSVAQVQAGQNNLGTAAVALGSQAVPGTGAQAVVVGGLTAETAYYFYFQQEDAAANDSNVAGSASFTTPAAGVAPQSTGSSALRKGRSHRGHR